MRKSLGFFVGALLLVSGCRVPEIVSPFSRSDSPVASRASSSSDFLASGSIILSQRVPDDSSGVAAIEPSNVPILGYAPTVKTFLPASNEVWLQIDSDAKVIKVFRGEEQLRVIQGEGQLSLKPGEYALQAKKENPTWYASDEYFKTRHLVPPPEGDERRFRKGALGVYALFPAPGFAIHSGAVWTKEVGGFRVDTKDLAFIYGELEVGALMRIE